MSGGPEAENTIVLDEIPVHLDEERFRALVRIADSSPYAASAGQLLRRVRLQARPKACYRVCYVEDRSDPTVLIGGVRFSSAVLSANLREVQRVFPYVVTCGTELDEFAGPNDDLLSAYWLDTLKELVLGEAVEFLRGHLAERFALKPAAISAMNPGSGNKELWPIAQQKPLFRLLGDVERLVGVCLTDSFLMIPNKTVSGVFFPTEVPFVSCRLCSRERCPQRRAPYGGPAAVPSRQRPDP